MLQTLRKVAHLIAGKPSAATRHPTYLLVTPIAFQRHNVWPNSSFAIELHDHQVINNEGRRSRLDQEQPANDSCERKLSEETKKENYHSVERSYGEFIPSFTITSFVEANNVNAEFKDGAQRATFAKSKESKPKHIEVIVK
jgi:Hsp20/alpha crystallin family protein